MPLRRSTTTIGSAVVALALATTACTSSASSPSTSQETGSTSASSSTSMSMAPSSSSSSSSTTSGAAATAAATLRAGLDSLFREHVNLTGFTVQTAVETSLTSPRPPQPLKALDDNTVALGSAIGSVYGGAAKTAFIKMWRAHIGFFVNYTKGLATNDQALVAKSQKQLAGYKADFAKFLGGATGLPADRRRSRPAGPHHHPRSCDQGNRDQVPVRSVEVANGRDAHGRHRRRARRRHREAEEHCRHVTGPASTLRSGLTGLLIQHVAQTAAVVQTAVETSLTSPQTAAAVKALDDNTVALGSAIGSVYGGAAKTAFIKMWRAHIGFFVNYTKGLATHDQALVAKSQKQLAGYKADFAQVPRRSNRPARHRRRSRPTGPHHHPGSCDQGNRHQVAVRGDKVLMAESHMAGTAAVLASAIAEQKHLS